MANLSDSFSQNISTPPSPYLYSTPGFVISTLSHPQLEKICATNISKSDFDRLSISLKVLIIFLFSGLNPIATQ